MSASLALVFPPLSSSLTCISSPGYPCDPAFWQVEQEGELSGHLLALSKTLSQGSPVLHAIHKEITSTSWCNARALQLGVREMQVLHKLCTPSIPSAVVGHR